MMNVLVTGGNGQLASCIKDIENQYENLHLIYTDYQELDICDLNQIKIFFNSNLGIDYCINCAAYTAVDQAETDVDKAFEVNATGPKNLAQVCSEFGTTLIHISTDFVFGGTKTTPYTEMDAPNPGSVYGASKWLGEENIIEALKAHLIIRTSWLYSEHGSNFMKKMLKLAQTRKEISVVSDQIGSPTYARDLAEVILKIINTKNMSFGVYHYSNEGAVSWYDFAKAIFEKSNIEIKLNPIKTVAYPMTAIRPKYSVMATSKIKNMFQLQTSTWKEKLTKALRLNAKQNN